MAMDIVITDIVIQKINDSFKPVIKPASFIPSVGI